MIEALHTFDCLPLHPASEDGESCSSYLIRLCQLNGLSISFIRRLNHLLGGGVTLFAHPDYPVRSWELMSKLSSRSQKGLLNTTLYWIALKFGLQIDLDDEQATNYTIRNFFGVFLSNSLRFCPQCISQFKYYRLMWRFHPMPGCQIHGVYLMDRCWKCKASIPLLSARLEIGYCLKCGADLRNGVPARLVGKDRQLADLRASDFDFLCSPQGGFLYCKPANSLSWIVEDANKHMASLVDYLAYVDEPDYFALDEKMIYHQLEKRFAPDGGFRIVSNSTSHLAHWLAEKSGTNWPRPPSPNKV